MGGGGGGYTLSYIGRYIYGGGGGHICCHIRVYMMGKFYYIQVCAVICSVNIFFGLYDIYMYTRNGMQGYSTGACTLLCYTDSHI